MVRIAKEPEGDPTERLNLDDYNSDDFNEYLSDSMETTTPTITEAQVTTKEDLSAPPPPPAVTVTVQLDKKHPAEDLYERHHQLNQKRALRRQRLANSLQEQQGDNYDYSNCDLRSVINVGRNARNVIISRRKEREEVEAYSPSSNYRIPPKASASFKKYKPATTSTILRVNHAPNIKVNRLRVETGSTKYCYASALSTQRALTRSSSVTHSARPLGHLS